MSFGHKAGHISVLTKIFHSNVKSLLFSPKLLNPCFIVVSTGGDSHKSDCAPLCFAKHDTICNVVAAGRGPAHSLGRGAGSSVSSLGLTGRGGGGRAEGHRVRLQRHPQHHRPMSGESRPPPQQPRHPATTGHHRHQPSVAKIFCNIFLSQTSW